MLCIRPYSRDGTSPLRSYTGSNECCREKIWPHRCPTPSLVFLSFGISLAVALIQLGFIMSRRNADTVGGFLSLMFYIGLFSRSVAEQIHCNFLAESDDHCSGKGPLLLPHEVKSDPSLSICACTSQSRCFLVTGIHLTITVVRMALWN